MEVFINEHPFSYTSDYPEGWKISSGDPFKFPVQIGTYTCFIKMFRKPAQEIPGIELLKKLCGVNVRNLPRIYDIKADEFNGAAVQYLFYEYTEGENLDALITEDASPDLNKLSAGLFTALNTLHSAGFWFPDFCEKNIYRARDGRFLLLDLDSCLPLSVLPANDAAGSKDYWSPVYQYYRDIIGYSQIKTQDLPGNLLNVLQLYLMIFRLHVFISTPEMPGKYAALLPELHHSLLAIVPQSKLFFHQIFPSFNPAEFGPVSVSQFSIWAREIIQRRSEEPEFIDPSPEVSEPEIDINSTAEVADHEVFIDPLPEVSVNKEFIDPSSEVVVKDVHPELRPEPLTKVLQETVTDALKKVPQTLSEPVKKEETSLKSLPLTISGIEKMKLPPSRRLWITTGLVAVFIAGAALMYVKVKTDRVQQVQEAARIRAINTALRSAPLKVDAQLSPDTLVIIARQVRSVRVSLNGELARASDLKISLGGKAVPANLIGLKSAKKLSVITFYIDSAYSSGNVKIEYPGMSIDEKMLIVKKIKNPLPKHTHVAELVTIPDENHRKAEAEKIRGDSIVHAHKSVHIAEQGGGRSRIIAADFQLTRSSGLMHQLFSRKQCLIRGRGFLSAKNGFEAYDLHQRLNVIVESDSLLQVKTTKKINALLLKLVAKGSTDTLWVKER